MADHKYRSWAAVWPRSLFGLAFAALAYGWIDLLTGGDQFAAGSLLTATVAAASLIYSLGRGQEASKDQYTLTLIARRFDDGGYGTNVRMASDLRRRGAITPDTSLKWLQEIEWVDPHDAARRLRAAHAIIPILNYWEHVCTAYVDDRINRRLVEDLVQDLLRELVQRYPRIIGDMRAEDATNMEHLCAVWFVIAPDAERRALAARLGPAPQRLSPHDQSRWAQARANPVRPVP